MIQIQSIDLTQKPPPDPPEDLGVPHLLEWPQLRQIIVLSRSTASKFESEAPWAVISVRTPGLTIPTFRTNKVLYLAFDDNSFQPRQAEMIRIFVDQDIPRTTEVLVVQSEFGTSRGPAIAAALGRIYGIRGTEVYLGLPFDPNKNVYNAVLEAYRSKFGYG